MQSITESLNKQQAQAVTAEPKSALILAGAGSGKTRVLTSRIAYLLQQNMAHPSEILAVTFTNKAAKEMLARLQNMIPINPRAMWVGTFHGLCNRLLRLHHQEAGLPSTFAILDMSDQLGVIKRVMKANGIDTEEFKPRVYKTSSTAARKKASAPLRSIQSSLKTRHIFRFMPCTKQCFREKEPATLRNCS